MTQHQPSSSYSTSTALTFNMLILNVMGEPVNTLLLPQKNIVSKIEPFKMKNKNQQSLTPLFFTSPKPQKPFIIQQPFRYGMKK